MEFFLSGSQPLIDFVICDVMSDMANKLLSLSMRPERGLSTMLHCLQWYKLVLRTRSSTPAVQYLVGYFHDKVPTRIGYQHLRTSCVRAAVLYNRIIIIFDQRHKLNTKI